MSMSGMRKFGCVIKRYGSICMRESYQKNKFSKDLQRS